MKLSIKFFAIIGLIFFCAHCGNPQVYVVYNKHGHKERLILEKNIPVIVQDAISCIDCVKHMLDFYSEKGKVVIVILVPKGDFEKIRARKNIEKHLNNNVRLVYQYSSNSSIYKPSRKSGIFLDYDIKHSPVVLIRNENDSIQLLTYVEFLTLNSISTRIGD